MLYSKQQLETLTTKEDKAIALKRYLFKVHNKDTKRLLLHESEYICSSLPSIYNDEDLTAPAYNIYELDFCSEYLFKRLILLYLDHLDFLKPIFNGVKNLEDDEIARDKRMFNALLNAWSKKLDPKFSDVYVHEVKIEYRRKIKILKELFENGLFGRRLYERKITEQKLASYYTYYVAKSFFKSNKNTFVTFEALNTIFSINIYSYIHIISRHYIPKMHGIDPERSFNGELKCINPFNLPYSIRDLLTNYFDKAPASYFLNPEYMIFSEGTNFYIIWWKNKRLDELKFQNGYEIRTLYKIEADRDKQKINHLNFHEVNSTLKYYY